MLQVCGSIDDSISNSKNKGKIVGKEYVRGIVVKSGAFTYNIGT